MQIETVDDARCCRAESVLLSGLHHELVRIGAIHLRREPLRNFWTPESLVNEAYIRLVEQYGSAWTARENVLALWSCVMRNVLIDSARSFRALKRNRGQVSQLTAGLTVAAPNSFFLNLRVRLAMDSIQSRDPRLAAVIRMHFSHGMTCEEIAGSLRVSSRTVRRILRVARSQLFSVLV